MLDGEEEEAEAGEHTAPRGLATAAHLRYDLRFFFGESTTLPRRAYSPPWSGDDRPGLPLGLPLRLGLKLLKAPTRAARGAAAWPAVFLCVMLYTYRARSGEIAAFDASMAPLATGLRRCAGGCRRGARSMPTAKVSSSA